MNFKEIDGVIKLCNYEFGEPISLPEANRLQAELRDILRKRNATIINAVDKPTSGKALGRMISEDDLHLRERALDFAIQSTPHATSADVVSAAKEYLTFLGGTQ